MIITSEYDPATGQIYRNQYFDGPEIAELNASEFYVEGEYRGEVYYILDGQPTERPTQSTTLDGHTLTGLPIPATLHIDGETYPVDDGEAELDFILPGTYRLRVEAWPYRDWEGEVTV